MANSVSTKTTKEANEANKQNQKKTIYNKNQKIKQQQKNK